jgi:transposase
VQLWRIYIQLTEVEQAFKELKNDLAIRPVHHQKDECIEAHIFVSFLAYCLQVTLKAKLKSLAGGLTSPSIPSMPRRKPGTPSSRARATRWRCSGGVRCLTGGLG